jgi:hypothetical protein
MTTAQITEILRNAGFRTWETKVTHHVRTNATIAQCAELGLVGRFHCYATGAINEYKVLVERSK